MIFRSYQMLIHCVHSDHLLQVSIIRCSKIADTVFENVWAVSRGTSVNDHDSGISQQLPLRQRYMTNLMLMVQVVLD